MKILGIETSCDETAAAVWLDDRLGSNIIASQSVHTDFGGVVPELASRAHVQLLVPTVSKALADAGLAKTDLNGIAVTHGPGLAGSLLVGLNFAKSMSLGLDIPLISVNHIEGHIFSNSIESAGPEPPFIALIVSGGHTQLVLVQAWARYKIIGKTRDDAAGEAFDKVAKMLDLPYPGGPPIEKLAKEGNSEYLNLPKAKLKDSELDFSYSGLKTAVLYHLQSLTAKEREKHKADVAASFQVAAVDVLVANSVQALKQHGIHTLTLAGGVACNEHLRMKLRAKSEKVGFELFYPAPVFCTDNGAMIARAGKYYLETGQTSTLALSPRPSLSLERNPDHAAL